MRRLNFNFRSTHPTVVACSWHQHHLLLLAAQVQGRDIELLDALTVPLEPNSTPEQIGQRLNEQLRARRLKHFQLLIGLPRSRVEMLSLALPPASDAELVELVRNEVMRQLTDLPEDAIVDFHAVPGDAEAMRHVEAAVLRPETAAQIYAACEQVGQRPAQMVLRPLAIASLFARLAGRAHHQALLLTVMDCDADMSLFSHGQVIFSRTVRLKDEEAGPLDASRVSDEIRRTLAVAPLEPADDEDVAHIYMFDDLKRSNEFIEQLADELQLPVSLLDPLVGLRVAKDVDLQHLHRFPALIGMIRDYADQSVALDFAHPKQPPTPPRHGRKIALYAGAAAVGLLLVAGYFRSQLNASTGESRELAQQVASTEKMLKKLRTRTAIVDAVQRWQATDIQWLNELRDLSQEFPAAEQAVVQRITMAPSSGGTGMVSMSVRVTAPEIVGQLENKLRDETHQVNSKRISQAEGRQAFPCQFETQIVVKPQSAVTTAPADTKSTPLVATQR